MIVILTLYDFNVNIVCKTILRTGRKDMPINSFENYSMSWVPDKTKLTSPIYLSIAKLLEQDIRSGNLAGNTKLPPQRELADFLDLNLSTITRAFKICENKGLIYANIGQGTFVSPNAAIPSFEKGENNSIAVSYTHLRAHET